VRHRPLRAHHDGVAAPVVLGATHQAVTELVPFDVLWDHRIDVPDDPGSLIDPF